MRYSHKKNNNDLDFNDFEELLTNFSKKIEADIDYDDINKFFDEYESKLSQKKYDFKKMYFKYAIRSILLILAVIIAIILFSGITDGFSLKIIKDILYYTLPIIPLNLSIVYYWSRKVDNVYDDEFFTAFGASFILMIIASPIFAAFILIANFYSEWFSDIIRFFAS